MEVLSYGCCICVKKEGDKKMSTTDNIIGAATGILVLKATSKILSSGMKSTKSSSGKVKFQKVKL